MLSLPRLRMRAAYRTLIFMPTMLSVVIIGFSWQLILSPLWGIAKMLLQTIGLGFLFGPWLGQENTALLTVSLISVWQFVGIPMILIYTALLAIPDELIDATAWRLLHRYGVIFRDLLAREWLPDGWRSVHSALRRLEARGLVRGGRFVSGFTGEQFALPEAIPALRRVRSKPDEGEIVRVSAADPLNLVGILTPGPRVPAGHTRWVIFRDGLPIAVEDRDGRTELATSAQT